MKILITGAAGFIGSHTAEALKQQGYEISGIDNFSPYYDITLKEQTAAELERQGIEIMRADLADETAYTNLPRDFNYIFHFAAQPGISADVSFEQYLRNNFSATKNVLAFAQRNTTLQLFVNISTSSVYGKDATGNEETVPMPFSYYGVTKLAGEQLALSYARACKLNACSLRLFSVYGPRERPDKLFTKLISSIIDEKPFPLYEGSEKHVRSFTYVGDIVRGIISVISKAADCNGQIINIGTEAEHTTQYGIETAEALLGKKALLQLLPPRPGDQFRTKANIEKAKLLLDYQPSTTLEQGLSMQIDWYKKYFTANDAG